MPQPFLSGAFSDFLSSLLGVFDFVSNKQTHRGGNMNIRIRYHLFFLIIWENEAKSPSNSTVVCYNTLGTVGNYTRTCLFSLTRDSLEIPFISTSTHAVFREHTGASAIFIFYEINFETSFITKKKIVTSSIAKLLLFTIFKNTLFSYFYWSRISF